MFFINTNVINWWPLSTGINGSSFLESVAETKQPSPAREYSWPQVDLCVGVMYHVTMETADICSEHRPEEAETPTRAGTRKCTHRHTRARIFTYTPRGQAGQETVRRNQSQHSPLSLGVFTPRPLSEGLSTYSPIHWRSILSCIPTSLCVYCLLVLCSCLSLLLSAIHHWVFCFSQWAKWNSVPVSLLLPKYFKHPLISFSLSYSFLWLSTPSCTHEQEAIVCTCALRF